MRYIIQKILSKKGPPLFVIYDTLTESNHSETFKEEEATLTAEALNERDMNSGRLARLSDPMDPSTGWKTFMKYSS